MACEVERFSIGVITLSAMLRKSGLFPIGAFEAAIRRYQRTEVRETNLAALWKGVGLVAWTTSKTLRGALG